MKAQYGEMNVSRRVRPQSELKVRPTFRFLGLQPNKAWVQRRAAADLIKHWIEFFVVHEANDGGLGITPRQITE
jgi:hypothetical protein